MIPPDVVAATCRIARKHGLHPFIYRRHGNFLHAYHSTCLSPAEQHFVDLRNHLPLKQFVIADGDLCAPADDALLIFMLNDYAVLERAYDEIAATVPCSPQVYRDSCDPSDPPPALCPTQANEVSGTLNSVRSSTMRRSPSLAEP